MSYAVCASSVRFISDFHRSRGIYSRDKEAALYHPLFLILAKMQEILKWERPETLTTFPVIPVSQADREYCAKAMTVGEILETSVRLEDSTEKRRHRWKYVRNLFAVINKPPFDKASFENALFAHAHYHMSLEQFTMRLMIEFKFPTKLRMDDYLRWLYLSFDTFRSNSVDWREMIMYYRVLRYFRLIKESSLELILLLFDVYGEGGSDGSQVDRDRIEVSNAKTVLLRIFQVPCLTEPELYGIETMLESLFDHLDTTGNKISRRALEVGFKSGRFSQRAVAYWSTLCWDRLPTDQRLTILDEAQTKHAVAAEVIISRFQLQQAIVIYTKNTLKHVLRAWKIVTVKASGARAFALSRLRLRALRMMQRWQRISRRYALYRRKRILAQVMGDYSTKARCFQRIKLHNTIIRRITRVSGSLLPNAKRLVLAASHLREFRRLYDERVGLYRWRAVCRMWKNHENARAHYRRHLLRSTFLPWFKIAHEAAVAERQEAIVRENQLSLMRMLEEAEAAATEIALIEQQREAERQRREKEEQDRLQAERLQRAKQQAAEEKEREKRALLREQAEARTARIRLEMARLKIVFNMEFEFKAQEAMERTKERTISYIENPENKLTIDLKFEQLKREFHANPTPETREREKMLSSYKNILFLFIDAQLKKERIELPELYSRYDLAKKGYLTYGEFATMIRSLNTRLNEAQVSNVIRHVDADRDGYITLQECQSCMTCVHKMGAPGSSWKLYIDPAEDVICYHNFETNEKFLEYEITDKVLRGINIANIYAEAEYNMQEELKKMRRDEWQVVLRSYMARRLQYMYRFWKGRQIRKRLVWRLLQREQAARTRKQRLCAEFITRHWRGKKARRLFARQLAFTVEKVWDRESNRVFYYNHFTKSSSWEKPHLFAMRRPEGSKNMQMDLGAQYSAVLTEPCVWLPVEAEATALLSSIAAISNGQWEDTSALAIGFSEGDLVMVDGDQAVAAQSSGLPMFGAVSYFHANAKRTFPGKPDGFPLCCVCNIQLAVHSCLDCYTTPNALAHYCFTCHRNTHSNPFGFHQHAKAKRVQYNNPDFVSQLYNFQHRWEPTKPTSCDMCQGRERLFAAFQCEGCGNKSLCRRCFSRIHHPSMKPAHRYYRL
jgi:hypothetical protein